MEWVLLVLLVLAVVALGVVALVVNAGGGARWAAHSLARRRDREPEMRLPAPRCLRCRGTGWLNHDPERTFTFTGDGFEDKHVPATMCPDCGGAGVAPER